MCGMIAQTILGVYGTQQEGAAQTQYYQYLANTNETQGDIVKQQAEQQSSFIQESSKENKKLLKEDQARFNASTVAALAGAGVSGVTAEDIVSNNFREQQRDEAYLKYNADVESYRVKTGAVYEDYALRSQADQYRIAGGNARKTANINTFSTLLGTANSVGRMFI